MIVLLSADRNHRMRLELSDAECRIEVFDYSDRGRSRSMIAHRTLERAGAILEARIAGGCKVEQWDDDLAARLGVGRPLSYSCHTHRRI